jgi:hypothetical protein
MLTPEVNAALTEATELARRLRESEAELGALNDESALAAAQASDADAQLEAVRAGGQASVAGTPARDSLLKDRERAALQTDVLGRAVVAADEAVRAAFATTMADDPKRATELAALATKYRRAADTLVKLRAEFVEAKAFAAYIHRAAGRGLPEAEARRMGPGPIEWRGDDGSSSIQLPSPPGHGVPGPVVSFSDALKIITAADLADNEGN